VKIGRSLIKMELKETIKYLVWHYTGHLEGWQYIECENEADILKALPQVGYDDYIVTVPIKITLTVNI